MHTNVLTCFLERILNIHIDGDTSERQLFSLRCSSAAPPGLAGTAWVNTARFAFAARRPASTLWRVVRGYINGPTLRAVVIRGHHGMVCGEIAACI